MDIIVTTPKGATGEAAREGLEARKRGGYYFRWIGKHIPKNFGPGDRIWYTEGGLVRGFGICQDLIHSNGELCSTTGKTFGAGWFAWIDVQTWKWVKPFAYRGFQGFRYCDFGVPEIVGDWLSPMPEATS